MPVSLRAWSLFQRGMFRIVRFLQCVVKAGPRDVAWCVGKASFLLLFVQGCSSSDCVEMDSMLLLSQAAQHQGALAGTF